MKKIPKPKLENNLGATAVITHRIETRKQAQYERWLNEIVPLCQAAPGFLDWHIVRPIRGLTEAYTVIIRFDTQEHLRSWLESKDRANLIKKVKPLIANQDGIHISSGLDFWFTPAGSKAKIPARWKQYLMTWSAIYPLVMGIPLAVLPQLDKIGFPDNHALRMLLLTAIIVFLMVYIVMPRYTKLMQRWLFK